MADESPSTTRLFILHGGQETGPLQFREVMDRLRTGSLGLDDLCRLEGAEAREPLRVVLPKLGPQLPTLRVRPSTSRSPTTRILLGPNASKQAETAAIPKSSEVSPAGTSRDQSTESKPKASEIELASQKRAESAADAHFRPRERIVPGGQPRDQPTIQSSILQRFAPERDDNTPTDSLREKIVIRATPSDEPAPPAPSKTPVGMLGWIVATALFTLLVVLILQRRSQLPPQAHMPPASAPGVTQAPTAAQSPPRRPNQRDYAYSKFIQAKQAFQQHDLKVARALVDQADAADPNQPAILNLRGEILSGLKEYELAEAAFRKAIEIDPNFYDAKNNLADLLSKKQATVTSPPATATVTPQITPAESPSVAKRMPGERFPETRWSPMTSWEVEKWTPDQLRYAINEMYARHGADFLDKEIKRQFSTFEWYHPRSGQNYDQTETLFSTVEMYNLKQLGVYRDARKSAPTPGSPSGGSSPPSDSKRQQTARKPKFLDAPHPTYPPNVDKMRVTGSGRFKITFNERGNARSVEIVQSTGNRILDGNTIKTLKRWRVDPGSPFYVVVPGLR
jgi:TonB family protein